MRIIAHLLYVPVCLTASLVKAQALDGCPKNEHACLDVINSSYCLQSNVAAAAAAEVLAQCVSYDGAASSLPGSVKVSLTVRYSLRI